MFAIHDRTRRLLCRLGFLLLCAAPTLTLAVWSGATRSSWYAAVQRVAWEHRLRDTLGLVVALQRVSYPNRDVTVLERVKFVMKGGVVYKDEYGRR